MAACNPSLQKGRVRESQNLTTSVDSMRDLALICKVERDQKVTQQQPCASTQTGTHAHKQHTQHTCIKRGRQRMLWLCSEVWIREQVSNTTGKLGNKDRSHQTPKVPFSSSHPVAYTHTIASRATDYGTSFFVRLQVSAHSEQALDHRPATPAKDRANHRP